MNRNSVTAAEGTEGNRNEHQWGYRDHQTHGMSERTETLDHDEIRPPSTVSKDIRVMKSI